MKRCRTTLSSRYAIVVLFGFFGHLATLPLSHCFAEIPHLIRYQGQATDNQGVPLQGSYTIKFHLYTSPTETSTSCSADQICRWEEQQEKVWFTNGHFSVLLGTVKPLDVDWSKPIWLGIQVITDQINPPSELAPRHQITSVPIAFMAEQLSGAIMTQGSSVGIGTVPDSNARLQVMGGDVLIGAPALHDTTTEEDLLVKGNLVVDGKIIQHQGSANTFSDLTLNGQLVSKVPTGTSPFVIFSTTTVTNLDADTVDGQHAGELLNRANHTGTQPASTIAGTFAPSVISPQGSGSGLNADAVDGRHASELLSRANHTGTQSPSTISPQGPGSGLNADLLDGMDASAFGDATAANQATLLNRIGASDDAGSLSPSTLFAGLKGLISQVDNAYSACFPMLPYDSSTGCGIVTCTTPSCPGGGWTQVTTFNYVPVDNTGSGCSSPAGKVCTAVVCCLTR